MPATLQYSAPPPARPRPTPGRHRYTLEELLRRAAASVENGPAKLIVGTFRPTQNGRPLTRREKGLMLLMAGGLSVAIWLHAQPVPVSAHTVYYQSLAASARLESGAPQPLAESALREIGRDWRPAALFACMQPAFWHRANYADMEAQSRRAVDEFAQDVRMSSDLVWNSSTSVTLTVPDNYTATGNKVTYAMTAPRRDRPRAASTACPAPRARPRRPSPWRGTSRR